MRSLPSSRTRSSLSPRGSSYLGPTGSTGGSSIVVNPSRSSWYTSARGSSGWTRETRSTPSHPAAGNPAVPSLPGARTGGPTRPIFQPDGRVLGSGGRGGSFSPEPAAGAPGPSHPLTPSSSGSPAPTSPGAPGTDAPLYEGPSYELRLPSSVRTFDRRGAADRGERRFGGRGASPPIASPRIPEPRGTGRGTGRFETESDAPHPSPRPGSGAGGGSGISEGGGLRRVSPSAGLGGNHARGENRTPGERIDRRGPAGTPAGGVLRVPRATPVDGLRALRRIAEPRPPGAGGGATSGFRYSGYGYRGAYGFYGSFFWGFWWGSWCGWFPYYCNSPWFPYWCYYWWGYVWWPYGYTVPAYYYPTIIRTVPRETIIIESSDSGGGSADAAPVGGVAPAGGGNPGPALSAFELHLRLGDDHFRRGEFDRAAEEYKLAVLEDPDSGVARYALADALFALGDYHFAAYSLRKAIERQPDWLGRKFLKREFYEDPSLFDAHMTAVRAWLEMHPFDEAALFVLAYNLFRDDQAGEAEKVLARLQDIREDDPVYETLREAISGAPIQGV